MKKVWIVGFVLLTVLFGASTRKPPLDVPKSYVNTDADVQIVADPLMQQIVTAKVNGDRATYEKLLQEWKKQYASSQESKFPLLFSENEPSLNWGSDKVIYAGTVNYNSWAVSTGIDDEAIDVDYVNGDTLRAVIACPDTAIRVYQSTDGGMTWAWWHAIIGFGAPVYEPQIINQNQGWCHLF